MVTALGLSASKTFIEQVVEPEIEFQNTRFEKHQAVLKERISLLEKQVADLGQRITELTDRKKVLAKEGGTAGDWFALEQTRIAAVDKIAAKKQQLNLIKQMTASDLRWTRQLLSLRLILCCVLSGIDLFCLVVLDSL